MAKTLDLEGFRELDKILDNLPKNISNNAKHTAGRKAARPILARARQLIRTVSTKTKGNLDGFEHLRALAKLTKIEVWKGTTFVRISRRAPDLPMASNRSFWDALGVGYLFAFGRQSQGKGARKKLTGTTEGFKDWVDTAGKEKGSYAKELYKKEIILATEKAITKAVKKYGKRN